MIENYKKDKNGVIFQVQKNKINYNLDYIKNSYNNYGTKVDNMSYLRYGYLVGILPNVINSILDVGYGNGSFLSVCKKKIDKCYGTDISGYMIPDGCSFIDSNEIFNRHFDVVCFFDSLEHFDDIYFLDKLNCDYIFISLPECHYISDKWFDDWKHRRVDEHLWHFNKKSLSSFMHGQGFELVNYSNIEDIIRTPIDENPNILTGVFKKIKNI